MLTTKLNQLSQIGVEIFLGIELEFYSKYSKRYFNFKNVILKKEIGEGQLEAVFPHTNDILSILKDVIRFRIKFKNKADFRALPVKTDPPSGMQFNISILKNGQNILNNNILYFVLEEAKFNMQNFAPTQNCQERLKNIEGIKKYRNSPYTFCIGSKHNRTAAIRLLDGYFEHRIASPLCLILKSFNSILNGILKGIKSQNNYYLPLIHSNAFEDEVIRESNLEKILNYLKQ